MPKLEIPFAAANGGIDCAVLAGKRFIHSYSEGKRTGDTPTATTFTAAMQGNGFTPLNVKIEGSTDPLPGVEDQEIKAACAALKPILVRFKECKVSVYTIEGQMRMSATASGVELIAPNK